MTGTYGRGGDTGKRAAPGASLPGRVSARSAP